MPTLKHGRNDELLTCSPSPPARANVVHDRKKLLSAKNRPPPLALFNKVRNFRSAAQIRALGLYPYFRTISSAQDSEIIINGRKVLMLGSNSYLGLTNHPKIKEAAKAAIEKYGTGCAGSRFLNGTLDIHLELEQALARLVNKEAALLYSTGFQVNLGVISALVGKGDFVLADKSDHASIVEGCQLSSGNFVRFAHKDMAALESRLQKIDPEAGKLIVVDGVFSMEGDIIQLPELCRLAAQYGAAVMVDDAHAIGVLGKNGAGTASHFGLTDQVQLIMGTFSKSLASLGGFIASDVAIGLMVIASGALTVLTYAGGHAQLAEYLQLARNPRMSELTIFCGIYDWRQPGLSVVQRASGGNLHGRRGVAGAGRRHGGGRGAHQAGSAAGVHRRYFRAGGGFRHPSGGQLQAARQTDLQDGPAAPSFRGAGVGRIEDHRALLDRRAGDGAVRAHHLKLR